MLGDWVAHENARIFLVADPPFVLRLFVAAELAA
jgi:hypothetical protein